MSEQEFQLIECRVDQDVIVVAIQPEEVMGEEKAMDLKADLQLAFQKHGNHLMVIDFRKVKFMTSRPFGAIAGFRSEYVKTPNAQIALCGLSVHLRGALTALHFVTSSGSGSVLASQEPPKNVVAKPASAPLFDIVTDTVEEAITALKQSS